MESNQVNDDEEISYVEKQLILTKEARPVEITLQLITKTSFDQETISSMDDEDKYILLTNLTTIHLEWQGIQKIVKLDIFDKLEILYLQHNSITVLEGFEMLVNLQYLALNDNKIKRIQNLKHLKKLNGLMLHNNSISKFELDELPVNLQILNLVNNQFPKGEEYKKSIVLKLQDLENLDGEDVTQEERFKYMGIFPKHLEGYSRNLSQFYKKNPTLQKDANPYSKIMPDLKNYADIAEQDMAHIRQKIERIQKENKADSVLYERVQQQIEEKLKKQQQILEEGKKQYIEPLSDQEIIAKLREKTQRILEKQEVKSNLIKANYYKELEEDAELHAKVIKIYHEQFNKYMQARGNIDGSQKNYNINIDIIDNIPKIFQRDYEKSMLASTLKEAEHNAKAKGAKETPLEHSQMLTESKIQEKFVGKKDFSELARLAQLGLENDDESINLN